MTIHMEWYRIFIHAANQGNLTKAARELHITQPSVSYAIKQLEEQLGVKLFDRQSKGVKLTPEGKSVLEYVERSFTLLKEGEHKIHSLRNLTSGELRIGASGPIIKHLLLPLLDQYHAEHPDVRIRLSQGKSNDIRTDLKDGQIDIGLVHLPCNDHELNVKQLAQIQGCFVVGKAYQHSAEHVLTSEELAQIPLLLLSRGSSTRQFVEHWFHSQGTFIEADMELSSMDILVEAAVRGYGAAFVTHAFIQEELLSEKLFLIRTAQPIPARTVAVATKRDSSLSLAASRFISLLKL